MQVELLTQEDKIIRKRIAHRFHLKLLQVKIMSYRRRRRTFRRRRSSYKRRY